VSIPASGPQQPEDGIGWRLTLTADLTTEQDVELDLDTEAAA
jgi:hypothetical protein